VHATDLGQLGKVYPIIEPDMVDFIKSRLLEKQGNGELDQLHEQFTDNAREYVRRPPGIELPRAQDYKSFAIDPTYTLANDLTDADGNVIYSAGLTFNPLSIKPMSKTLCFINGNDPDQVVWLKSVCGDDVLFKKILVSGDYLAVAQYLDSRVYFDHKGFLINYFHITAVPSVVRQSGDFLYVEEFGL
jgi:conjugal transfer pilus assembly protein TraW